MKQERQCKFCLQPIDKPKGIYCEVCGRQRKEMLAERKKQGLCITCGNEKATKTQKCDKCRQEYVDGAKGRRDRRMNLGFCLCCGDEPSIGGKLCRTCVLRNAARVHFGTTKRWKDLDELFTRQNGTCPYTGKNLTIGIDASVDHIIPKSRGGSLGTENMQWVFAPVNFMKHNLLEEEFLPIINAVYEYRHITKAT
jgi:hypothetical protein